MISELELDRAFSEKLVSSLDFYRWVLDQTKFRGLSKIAVLLHKEQAEAKPRKKPENWWRHWWCKLEDGHDSETDIFAVFGFPETEIRFALHIEDKPPHGKFTPNQCLNYKKRAAFMSNKAKYMNYSDFTTILLAPNSFLESNSKVTHHFDCIISYELVAEFIPLFSKSLQEAKH